MAALAFCGYSFIGFGGSVLPFWLFHKFKKYWILGLKFVVLKPPVAGNLSRKKTNYSK